MRAKWNLLLLALISPLFTAQAQQTCLEGYGWNTTECVDLNECEDGDKVCGENSKCFNTAGSHYCQCNAGFRASTNNVNFTLGKPAECIDINECQENRDICGPNASCINTISNYTCTCKQGFASSTGVETFHGKDNVTCRDIDECKEENACGLNTTCMNTQGLYYCICKAGYGLKSGKPNFTGKGEHCEDKCKLDKTICGNGTCHQGPSGHYCLCSPGFTNYGKNTSRCTDKCKLDKTICENGTCHQGPSGHYCACFKGFTNYGKNTSRCTALDCGVFKDVKKSNRAYGIMWTQLSDSCMNLRESEDPAELNGEGLLKSLLSLIDKLLSTGFLSDNSKISIFLDLVEQSVRVIVPFINTPGMNRSTSHTEMDLLVHTGMLIPQGLHTLSSKHAKLDIKLEEAAGDPSSYPGFTMVSLLSYSNLEEFADNFFSGMEKTENQSFKLNSKVVTISVSNRDTEHLKQPVNITLYHLDQSSQGTQHCVFWDASKEGGAWSARGCSVVESNRKYTVCSCNHLSSFAVLMALYDIEGHFELQLISWVGLSVSLICLFLCILTFSMIRAIKSPRTTIHLHLCISLFIATLIFLVGISQTQNKVSCAVVAGLLHFFYLAAFCWMCLEGIQLFRMVVLVFNTNFKTVYMMAGGYGVPAVIVAITALVNANGYGTAKYCWLNLDSIWFFFGPACVIIFVNIFFFIITVWKLAQKFSSLNPDLDSLHKIKAFTITAVAQLCILGIMWIFGCFQFEKGTIAMSYLFTIFGSLQGVMLFVMHCLLSKQVRDEYENTISRLCAPQKRVYSEFNHPHSSKASASRSSQDTGESHI